MNVRDLESKHIVQTYRRTPIVLVRGKGVRVYDEEGREYLDLLAGIGVGALGHGHEGLAGAHRRSVTRDDPLLQPVLSSRYRDRSRSGSRNCRGCRDRFSATAVRKRSRPA